MAITFEEKSNPNRTAIIVFLLVAVLAAAGFLAWKMLLSEAPANQASVSGKLQISKGILDDSRVASLELFPEIPAAAGAGTKGNPFSQSEVAAGAGGTETPATAAEVPATKTETPNETAGQNASEAAAPVSGQ